MGSRARRVSLAVGSLFSLASGAGHAFGLSDIGRAIAPVVQVVAPVVVPVPVLVVAPVVKHVAGEPAAAVAAPVAATVAAPTVSHVEKTVIAPATKAARDAAADTGKEVEKAAQAAGKAAERTAEVVPLVVAKGVQRVKEGKIVEALVMPQVDLYRDQEETAFEAMDHSAVIRTAAQVAASTYGGPLGSAGFQAWYVGRKSKDIGTGLKAGAIAGVTGAIHGGVAQADALGIAGKAVASGAAGGIASVASGGTFEDGFVSAAVASTASSAYRAYTGAPIDGRPGNGPVKKVAVPRNATPEQLKAAAALCGSGQHCYVIQDGSAASMRDVPYRMTNIGKFAGPADGPLTWKQEGSPFMLKVNKIPYMNAMSYGHDILAVDAGWTGDFALMSTIPPSMVFIYFAGGVDRDRQLLDTQVAAAEEDQR